MRLALLALAAVLLGCAGKAPPLTQAELASHNRGAALLGQFDYDGAIAQLAPLAAAHPERLDLQVDLAVATLNRQQAGDEGRARAILQGVVKRDPTHLRGLYNLALLDLNGGDPAAAAGGFKAVAAADPSDAYAVYFAAQAASQLGKDSEALAGYRTAVGLDPYLRSAYYGAFQILRAQRNQDAAMAMLDSYRRLDANPQARLAEFKYSRMGAKAEVLPLDEGRHPPSPPPAGPLFGAPSRLAGLESPQGEAGLTAVDLERGNKLSVMAVRFDADSTHPNRIWSGDGKGEWREAAPPPWAAVEGIHAALWGDIDNDGRVDLYLCRKGDNQLWMRQADGGWVERGGAAGVQVGEFDTRGGLMFDADHDGDLDLLLANADGPPLLLSNNLDGSFRPLGKEQGFDVVAPIRQAVAGDIDRDRDLDLLLVGQDGRSRLLVNDRLWRYRDHPNLKLPPLQSALLHDFDSDGYPELLGLAPDGGLFELRTADGANWNERPLEAHLPPGSPIALADLNGDGTPELLYGDQAGIHLGTMGERVGTGPLLEGNPIHAWLPLQLDPERGPSLLAWRGGELLLLPPGAGRSPFVQMAFSGMTDPGASMRSNASGIGVRVAVRMGSRWSSFDTLPASTLPGQSLQPVSVGLGGASRADFATLLWPDGVLQTELDLESGKPHPIVETQRQLSSCPVLFAWDGERYRFVSDLLGVGGLGYAVGPGEYAEPRPWENFLLPEGLAVATGGRYRLKIAEPMEEVAYIDQAELVRWELPPGWSMALDERMGISSPPPTGAPLFYRRGVAPSGAIDEEGNSLLPELARTDGLAAPLGGLDARFIGRLDADRSITLTFDTPLDGAPGEPWLIADGWVEYPYSQTMFAAWQAGAAYRAPTIEAEGADGKWVAVASEIGYPAGMPRRMAMPLKGLPASVKRLRISTNMEVYWDRFEAIFAEPLPEARRQTLPLTAAIQSEAGFAYRTTHPQRRPEYDYQRRLPLWDSRYLAGWYSDLGDVMPLVESHDDAVAIVGPGEEIHLEFADDGTPPAPGWCRYLVLQSRGWAKDMDLFTQGGESVAPLPSSGRPAEPRDRLHRQFHNRYRSGN